MFVIRVLCAIVSDTYVGIYVGIYVEEKSGLSGEPISDSAIISESRRHPWASSSTRVVMLYTWRSNTCRLAEERDKRAIGSSTWPMLKPSTSRFKPCS
jgi:hypothetical protein